MGLLSSKRKRRHKEGEKPFCHALEEELRNHVRPQRELGPAASSTGGWPRMFDRGQMGLAIKFRAGGETEIINW